MTRPEQISVDDFFKPPARAHAAIAPDGSRVAFLAPWQNRLNIWVAPLDGDGKPRRVTSDQTRSIHHFSWTDDPRWLLYLQDTGGDENWHVFRIDLDNPGAGAVDLTPFPGAMSYYELLPDKPGKAIVGSNKRGPTQMDAYELDIASGELTLLAENPGDVTGWLTSRRGDLFATKLNAAGDVSILQWDRTTGSLCSIAEYDGADYTMGIYPMVVTPDGTGIWMGSNEGTDRLRLVRLDVADGKQYAVDSHPVFDIDTRAQVWTDLSEPLIRSRATGELIGVRYLGERQVIHALDSDFADVLEALEKLSDGDVGALSSDTKGRKWVVTFTHDRDPDATYLYDHDTGQGQLLFRPYPHLDPEQLAPTRAVTIPSRDGLDLHGYLTLPVGIEPTNLPLVLLVHGGPWVRDGWMYSAANQLLANRGYAVLQINFRGSSGYGKAFQKAAVGEFAGKMHDDLLDGVEWAIAQGYADRDRIAIFGGSYGGYATLVGITFTPDVFAAAIDYVGISDLSNFMRTLPEVARPHLANNWHLFVGNPDDPEQLKDMLARSPITKIDQITKPLLVIQGANDVRVVQAESDNLVAGLRDRGVEVEYMVKEDEGHGFVNPDNVIDMFHAVDRFLAAHLGEGKRA